jgi:hypothetical protein
MTLDGAFVCKEMVAEAKLGLKVDIKRRNPSEADRNLSRLDLKVWNIGSEGPGWGDHR